MRVEAAAMQWLHPLAPCGIPHLLHYDESNHILAMPLLPPPAHAPLIDAIREGAVSGWLSI